MNIIPIHATSVEEFERLLDQSLPEGFMPSLALIFTSVTNDLPALQRVLIKKRIAMFGCTSCGEFLYHDHGQKITEGAVVCTLLDLAPGTFAVHAFHRGTGGKCDEAGAEVGKWAASVFPHPALLVVASGLDTDGEKIVRGIQSTAGHDLTMFGGLAGDDSRFMETFVFTDDSLDTAGIVALALDTRHYDIQGLATSGWIGIGADKTVTHAEENVVYTIDGQPALDIYTTYLSVAADDLPGIGVEYPLLLRKPGSDDILRAVLNVDREKKALIFAGSVPTGATVTFSSSPGFDVIESTCRKVNEFYDHHHSTDLLVLFSCMARHNALGPSIAEEIGHAWQNWKKPLIGFFTYGEIGNNGTSSCDFYNETFTMVSIKEKSHGG